MLSVIHILYSIIIYSTMRYLAIVITCLCLFLLPLQIIKKLPQQGQVSAPEPETDNVVACEPILIRVEGHAEPFPLEDYVKGVVQAEMPATFKLEALKAQAIAARTFALKTTNFGSKSIKPTTSHQAFISPSERISPPNIAQAITETASQILTYNNELITAMFFSTSNGKTESAKGYSGNDIPYLVITDSLGDTISPKFNNTKTFSLKEWNEAFGFNWTADHFKTLVLTPNESQRVKQMTTTQHEWTGREIRDILGLPSTDFEIDASNPNLITVSTKGYGHGVGMSQYGANAMAQEGSKVEEILKHYYPKTEIKNFQSIQPGCLKP
ncbi:stage II sporulation protein D [Paenisporosarcina sp. HGH0030]|uniref:stage II sporulation protein D n=1 Tax=Paenisporosarcina sp. HGH0030 TaxID=1078085 RepID=UPI00034EC858|nr:stage II sporulation protein D [Paenisporosarcina sp. HGH0030]EPD51626.1 stage II sporulation protein D [Paenisporosarcina sp. HGH0030]